MLDQLELAAVGEYELGMVKHQRIRKKFVNIDCRLLNSTETKTTSRPATSNFSPVAFTIKLRTQLGS
jgi:hypothetical protein